MNLSTIDILICPGCSSGGLRVEISEGSDSSVETGRLVCTGCGAWYRIENGIAELLPPQLADVKKLVEFARRHGLEKITHNENVRVEGKTCQKEFFHSENVENYEAQVMRSAYYKALYSIKGWRWIEDNAPYGAMSLDVGCGTGRMTEPLAMRSGKVLGLDISEDMLRVARGRMRRLGFDDKVDFIIADGETPPVQNGIFDVCLMWGFLHHAPDKATAISSCAAKLKPGGVYAALDPHASPVRFIFDLLMKIYKLYDEEASDEALISEEQMLQWTSRAGIEARTQLSTYIPPHVFYLMGEASATALLSKSDGLFGRIPLLKKLGGVIITYGVKTDKR